MVYLGSACEKQQRCEKKYPKGDDLIQRRTLLLSGISGCLVGALPAAAMEIRFPDIAWGAAERSLLDMRPIYAGDLPALPPPPASDSRESRQELRSIINAQARGVPDIRADRATVELHKPTGDVLRSRGVAPDGRVAPTVWTLMAEMDRDISIAVALEARRHGRLPPHVISPDIAEIATSPAMPAFPSMAFARFSTALGLLSNIDPTCVADREAFLADIAESLLLSGAHRATDLAAATLLSELYLAKALITTPVEEALATARIEMGIHQRLEGCRLPVE